MNRYAKMMLMHSAGRQGGRDIDRRDYDRPDMRGGYSVPESRFRDRDGREHYDNGRYAPMNRIGFSVDGEMERLPRTMSHDHQSTAGHDGWYDPSQMRPRVMPVFNRQMAEDWAHGMRNADGTQGPHWSMDKTKEVQRQYGVNCDEVEFWVVLNSIYSDYCEALKKSNASTLETYVCLARAWIEDRDAVPNKAAAYYTYVVEH